MKCHTVYLFVQTALLANFHCYGLVQDPWLLLYHQYWALFKTSLRHPVVAWSPVAMAMQGGPLSLLQQLINGVVVKLGQIKVLTLVWIIAEIVSLGLSSLSARGRVSSPMPMPSRPALPCCSWGVIPALPCYWYCLCCTSAKDRDRFPECGGQQGVYQLSCTHVLARALCWQVVVPALLHATANTNSPQGAKSVLMCPQEGQASCL